MIKKMFAGASKTIFSYAGKLRKKQTLGEEILWKFLRTKPFGFKFRRQHAYSNLILDFYCHKLHLCIEVDGSIHDLEVVKQKDEERQRQLELSGLTIIRYKNQEVIETPEVVMESLKQFLGNKHFLKL